VFLRGAQTFFGQTSRGVSANKAVMDSAPHYSNMFQTFSLALSSAGEKVLLENGKAFAPPCAVAEGVRVRRRRGETSFVPVTPARTALLSSLSQQHQLSEL
jgi:hypothetical protein